MILLPLTGLASSCIGSLATNDAVGKAVVSSAFEARYVSRGTRSLLMVVVFASISSFDTSRPETVNPPVTSEVRPTASLSMISPMNLSGTR
ncbi:unannotated protein [freshwater metagenome]|uniref:Unannotated protein n=1 Tax=freshwater metagenome TaxID=449393 RepID=A0A6J7QZI3_9ZZZZ